jgi:hypothetical protein
MHLCAHAHAPAHTTTRTSPPLFPHVTLNAVLNDSHDGIKRLQGELKDTKNQMAELKAVLYEKFGDAINLEE